MIGNGAQIENQNRLSAFPAFVRVEGRKVAIFGNGAEAFAKMRLLLNTRADVNVYAVEPEAGFAAALLAADVRHVKEPYVSAHLEGAVLVFAATGDAAIDARIVADARARHIPANAVDQPEICDFYTPALVNRAPVAVAIGTEGAGPVLGQLIRGRIDQMLPPSLGRLARLAASYRAAVERFVPRGVARRDFWREFFSGSVANAIERGDVDGAHSEATRLLDRTEPTAGHVWLVGAGPGAADLLTLRAQRALMQADAILYDALVPQEVVDMGRRDAERIAVGKRKGCHSKSQSEINSLLVELARQGRQVVRLKGGDPLVFGRAAEEMAALRDAGISYEIVPGITAAFAAAANFELPLTLRGIASSLVFTTGHDLKSETLPDWAALALSGATIAVYMGRTVAAAVAARLMNAGLPCDTAVAIVENASQPACRLLHGTLAELPRLEARDDLTGPVMVIIGDAVAGANFSRSEHIAAKRVPAETEGV
jgi:uroporphyrin-III C-methyltransferase/precorrin-2 dehydrogenase/sirohydrochlorin ferrochelatase